MHGHHDVDRLIVYSDEVRRLLEADGVRGDQIVVCGAPLYDRVPAQRGAPDDRLAARLGLRSGEPFVLVATSGPGGTISADHHVRVIEHVMRVSARMPEVRFVFKLHRKDDLRFYDRARASVPDQRAVVVRHGARGYPEDIFDWLQGAAALLTGASAAGLDALMMEVPLVTMDFAARLADTPYVAAGASRHATTEEDLTAAVREVLHGGARLEARRRKASRFLDRTYGRRDGHAADRAAGVLMGLAEGADRQ